MKIRYENEFVPYDGLECGQEFTCEGNCYMKTNQIDVDDCRPKAVNLQTGEMAYFGNGAHVAPVSCEVIVK